MGDLFNAQHKLRLGRLQIKTRKIRDIDFFNCETGVSFFSSKKCFRRNGSYQGVLTFACLEILHTIFKKKLYNFQV